MARPMKPDIAIIMKTHEKKIKKPPLKHGPGKVTNNNQGGYTSKEYNLTKKES